jgi:hypothetical protein
MTEGELGVDTPGAEGLARVGVNLRITSVSHAWRITSVSHAWRIVRSEGAACSAD